MTTGERGEDPTFPSFLTSFHLLLLLHPSFIIPPQPTSRRCLFFTVRSPLGHSQETLVSCVCVCAYICVYDCV